MNICRRGISASILYLAALFVFNSTAVLAAWPHIIFPSADGITLIKGVTYDIEWGSVRVDPVNIALCTEDIPGEVYCFHQIAAGVPNSGIYPWTIPNTLSNGSNYVISVGQVGISVAVSDNTFVITDSPVASWSVGAWSACSEPCDGGIRTHVVDCTDASGVVIPDSYCSGAKPATTEPCNTHSCPGMTWLPILLDQP